MCLLTYTKKIKEKIKQKCFATILSDKVSPEVCPVSAFNVMDDRMSDVTATSEASDSPVTVTSDNTLLPLDIIVSHLVCNVNVVAYTISTKPGLYL
jgi:hypothetical protein